MFSTVYVWHKAPFVRLVAPLMLGIIAQWNLQFPVYYLVILFIVCVLAISSYWFLSLRAKYTFSMATGLLFHLLIALTGCLLVVFKDVRHQSNWIGHHYKQGGYLLATLEEPLVEKANSFKAIADITAVYENDSCRFKKGKLILYFKKDSAIRPLHYGSQIIFHTPVQEIKNAGNPGSFDFKRYCLFQGITHQVYLTARDFKLLPTENKNRFNAALFNCREWVLSILRNYIHGYKEQGLAEALLVGYKDDLGRELIQSYSNTGVVHVIAISGLHLGLIYTLLLLLTRPFKKYKKLAWLRFLLILSALWLFSLLAGGQPSVLRSAVMFTCIATGEVIFRRASVYNTLALSAFLLLCYNPYWLWDVGFQLSYAALLSILLFFRPVYNWFYFSNKSLDFLWKLNAVTLSAQLLTLPLSVYHFHQLPTLFLFTNMVAVPLSSIILIGEIFLCVLFFLKPVAWLLGSIIERLVYYMNSYIERMDTISFSVWKGLSITSAQLMVLTVFVLAFCYWLMEHKRRLLWLSLICLFVFTAIRSFSLAASNRQKKLIVYNVPKHRAIDIIDSRTFSFLGDSDLLYDGFNRNFHLQPSRVLHRVEWIQSLPVGTKQFEINGQHILIIDTTLSLRPLPQKQRLPLLILSRNPRLSMSNLVQSFFIDQVVIDGSVPSWKASLWKHSCDSLHIPCHVVSENGAFMMNL